MSCEEEVVKIGKKLEKMISNNSTDQGSSSDLLKKLKDLKMNLNVLQKTRIGMIVNNFRKASKDEDVITVSKSLIKGWKKLLPAGESGSSQGAAKSDSRKDSSNGDTQTMTQSGGDSPSAEPPENMDSALSSCTAAHTSDPTRLKCRELLANALKVTDDSNTEDLDGMGDPDNISGHIEDYIFQEFNNTDTKYKNRVRSRVANLRDLKNPQLRENVLLGLISPEKIAKMTAEEMASDDMQKLRRKYTKESIDDHHMATTSGTKSDLFKCGKCKKKNTTYTQLQTRSSDEPMTTFVFCNECGNRWKFC
ncbi:transcription elongation factor S-II-like isoform X1 [Mizuhopecten yessoensis]|uniref:transcription elongation factor S-II-like isoform X1 n=1 Tax=Mizuhopecten yessoensis TaxID=6573 RepID=UPI000B4589BB|nr:transcription elongation factor S-II-like isoform X1 [Mizuhopecten yessoensis]